MNNDAPKFFVLLAASSQKLEEARAGLIEESNAIEITPESADLFNQLAEIDESLVRSKNELDRLFWKFYAAKQRIRPSEAPNI